MNDDLTARQRIEPFANLDGNGQEPVHAHHIAHRSLAPDRVNDITNITGVGVQTHVDHHDHGAPVPPKPTLYTVW